MGGRLHHTTSSDRCLALADSSIGETLLRLNLDVTQMPWPIEHPNADHPPGKWLRCGCRQASCQILPHRIEQNGGIQPIIVRPCVAYVSSRASNAAIVRLCGVTSFSEIDGPHCK